MVGIIEIGKLFDIFYIGKCYWEKYYTGSRTRESIAQEY